MTRMRVHLHISGLVQGVFFRSKTKVKCGNLGLRGFVKNLPDGGVEIVAEGEGEKIEELIEWAGEGPEYSKVESVEIKYEASTNEFEGFDVRY